MFVGLFAAGLMFWGLFTFALWCASAWFVVRFYVGLRDVWSSLGSAAVKGCVGDEVVTLYCHHHQVVCVLCAGLLLTLKGLLQQLLGCCWAIFFQMLLISA